jgi:MYXO-CTERM domain-containing protein
LRSALPAVVLCVVALPARAQQTISDDFESGSLGPWTPTVSGSPTLSVTSGAAHRGDAGLHIDLPAPTVNGTDSAYLSFFPSPAYAGPDLYVRYWVRPTLAGPPSMVPVTTIIGLSAITASADIPASDGGPLAWALNEIYVLGLGTDAGRVFLYSAGTQTLQAPFDFTGWTISEVRVGLVSAGAGGYSGALDFDDVRTSTSPPAALLGFDAGTARVGSCVPLKFSLLSSSGVPSPTPHDSFVSVSPSFGPLYADSACTMPGSSVTISAGTSIGNGWIVPQLAGHFSGEIYADDYVGATVGGNVGPALPPDAGPPDAGPPPDAGDPVVDAGAPDAGAPPAFYEVGCGCSSAEAPWGLALLGLAWRARRRLYIPTPRC